MKASSAVGSWWGLREGCWRHKTCRSLDRWQDLETWVGLAASAGQLGFGQSWGLPRSPPAFTLTTSPRASAVLSLLTLSILPAATVQARANSEPGLISCLVTLSHLLSPEQPEGIMGRWELEIFRSAPCREGLLGTSPEGPFPVARWGFMACAEEGRGSRGPERRGMGCVGCETIWETSRTSKESFCFWNLELRVFHTQNFCD